MKYSIPEQKHGDFNKKHMEQLPKPRCAFHSNMQHVTIQNNLDLVYKWFKTIDLNSKCLLGRKWTVIEILLVYGFCQEKINQSKTSKI